MIPKCVLDIFNRSAGTVKPPTKRVMLHIDEASLRRLATECYDTCDHRIKLCQLLRENKFIIDYKVGYTSRTLTIDCHGYKIIQTVWADGSTTFEQEIPFNDIS